MNFQKLIEKCAHQNVQGEDAGAKEVKNVLKFLMTFKLLLKINNSNKIQCQSLFTFSEFPLRMQYKTRFTADKREV
jgi:hypothetical protein